LGNIAGDFLGTEFGIASEDVELLNVDRGVHILFDHPLRNQDGILIVIPAPRHKGYQQVLAKRQLAIANSRTISHELRPS
jgi:hypothetical protein